MGPGDMPLVLDSHLAVVPIVVNAGAALLPAILAGLSTFVALLFKPRQLAAACKARPWIPAAVCGSVLVILGLWTLIGPGEDKSTRRGLRQADAFAMDWTRIALERIQARKAGALVDPRPPVSAVTSSSAFIFCAGPQRLGCVDQGPQGPLGLAWDYYPRWVDEAGAEQVDTEAMILSSPAVHGARVYGASCLLDPPDNFGAIFCVDIATGRQIWSIDQLNGDPLKGFFSSPAITADGRYLVIGQGLHPDTNCRLICVDTQAGAIHWTCQVSLHIESSPAIDGDVVYAGAGAIEDQTTHRPLSHTGFVLAVRISDGKELWRCDVADPESSPAVADGMVYIGSGFNGNAVVALRTGMEEDLKAAGLDRLAWRVATDYPITGAITLRGDRLFAGGGNGDFVYRAPNPAGIVLALDRVTGQVLWTAPMPDAALGAVAAGELLICPVASGEVIALDPKDGSRAWAARISGSAPVLAACAVTDQGIFALSQDGYLARLDATTGEVLDRLYINAEDRPGANGLCVSSPVAAAGRLIVGSETGGLRCYAGGPSQ